jgi:hypothetical protein
MKIELTDFAKRHFDKTFGGTKILDYTPEEFQKEIDNFLHVNRQNNFGMIDGYAQFCKLLPIKNFTNAKLGSTKITLENYQYLRSGYSARNESELPVFSRWLELPIPAPKAEYLMLVLYTKEQIDKETAIQDGGLDEVNEFDADYGIVAILGQDSDNEEPMKPETMIRNALGIKEGGSGVALDRDKYQISCNFWETHATVN